MVVDFLRFVNCSLVLNVASRGCYLGCIKVLAYCLRLLVLTFCLVVFVCLDLLLVTVGVCVRRYLVICRV